MTDTNLKLTIVGDYNTGKTTFVHKLKYGKVLSSETENPVEISLIRYYTNKGNILINIWDIKDGETRGLVPSYYANNNATLIFCKEDSEILGWVREVGRYSPKSPVILVNTGKKEIKESKFPYCNLSLDGDLEKPVELLLKQFLGDDTKFSRKEEFGPNEFIKFG